MLCEFAQKTKNSPNSCLCNARAFTQLKNQLAVEVVSKLDAVAADEKFSHEFSAVNQLVVGVVSEPDAIFFSFS